MKSVGQIFITEKRTKKIIEGELCVVCVKNLAIQYHHILPFSLGYRTVIAVCEDCHNKIHGTKFNNHRELTKLGLQKAKERGVKLGAAPKYTVEDIKKIKQLRLEGKSIRQISKKMNCSTATVLKHVAPTYILVPIKKEASK